MPESKLVLVVDDHVDERAVTRILLEHFGHRLARDPHAADIPVLAYTADRDLCHDRLGESAFAATLERPAAPQELLTAVVNRIGEPHPGSPQGRG